MRIFRVLWLLTSVLLLSLFALGSLPVGAAQLAPATITSFDVTTIDGKSVKDAPLMAGATYKFNFTLEVAAGLKENCILNTSLTRSPGLDRYWTMKGNYPGIDNTSWQPGQKGFSFNAVAGTAQLELIGSIPADYVTEKLANGQTLHMSKKMPVIELSLESGLVVADRQLEVIDSSIEEYRNALNAKKLLLTNMVADPAYSDLIKVLVANSEALGNAGYTDLAMSTLKAIPTSGWVAPQSSPTYYQWIIVGILAILAGICGFMLMKTRNEIGFIKRQADSQAKSLQILAKKASRIGDSTLTAGIEQVRKELEESIGGNQ